MLGRARRRIQAASGIVVLTLHRVLEDTDVEKSCSPPGMILRRATFETLLEFLKSECDVVPVVGAADPHAAHSSNPRPKVAITFDDGWRDTARVAWPLAKNNNCPICVFVCPGLAVLGSPFWPERVLATLAAGNKNGTLCENVMRVFSDAGIHVRRSGGSIAVTEMEKLLSELKKLPGFLLDSLVSNLVDLAQGSPEQIHSAAVDQTMTWDEMLRLAGEGVQIGSHTQTHQILPAVSPEQSLAELASSKAELESRLGHSCISFAYPNGSWSPAIRGHVEQAGYQVAFTNTPGVWTSATDRLLIPRVNVWEGTFQGPFGRFSSIVFQYVVFWRTARVLQKSLFSRSSGT